MADAYEVNVAPHNFYSPLATTISAHFAAAVPESPHHGDRPRRGAVVLRSGDGGAEDRERPLAAADRPGWGTEVNEEVVRAHPAKPR